LSVDVLAGGGMENPVFIGQVVKTIGISGKAYIPDGFPFTKTASFEGSIMPVIS
jgi:hypothetical protein